MICRDLPSSSVTCRRHSNDAGAFLWRSADWYEKRISLVTELDDKPLLEALSSSAYDQVRGKVAVEFADMGVQNLKNIARPIRVYKNHQFERDWPPRYRLKPPQEPNPPQVAAERAINDDRHRAFVV
jgi:hypothetical protein